MKKCVLVLGEKVRKIVNTESKKLAEYANGGNKHGTF